MAYDEALGERILDAVPDATAKKMFGGLGVFWRGNMFAGVHEDELMVKLGADAEAAISDEGVAPFSPGPKAMKGWVVVDPELVADDDQLQAWLARGQATVATLPPK